MIMIKNEFDENQIYKTVDSNFPPIESSFKTRNLVRSNIMDSSNEDSQHCDTFNAEHNNSIRDLQPFDSITHDKNIANKEDLTIEFKPKVENNNIKILHDEEDKGNSIPAISRNQIDVDCAQDTHEKQSENKEASDQISVKERKIRKNGFECPVNINILFTYSYTIIEIATFVVIFAPFLLSFLGDLESIISICIFCILYSLPKYLFTFI